MIGLDTNVVIRYLVQDDAAQACKANQLMEYVLVADAPGFINLMTLCEIVWVLKRNYQMDKWGLVSIVDGFLTTKQLVEEDVAVAWKALRVYGAGNADFSDAVIACANATHGCDKTVTFDKRAAKLDGMRLL
ncbi:MAG: type II toxin-antitoxin system VapC family toxin [Bdellovibrionota bacterium]